MTPDLVVEIGRRAIETMVVVAGPILGVSLAVGLLVSVFQAMTQINEATLSFAPKILAVMVGVLLLAPWMLAALIGFMTDVLLSIPVYTK
jgi:flagellar biosynthetic protein FliQ